MRSAKTTFQLVITSVKRVGDLDGIRGSGITLLLNPSLLPKGASLTYKPKKIKRLKKLFAMRVVIRVNLYQN